MAHILRRANLPARTLRGQMDDYGGRGSGRGQIGAARQGERFADEGACVPWATMAAIERAVADAEDRRAAAALGRRGTLMTIVGRLRDRALRLVRRP